MWRCETWTHNGKVGWRVVHNDGRVGIEWTDQEWLARDVTRKLNQQ